MRTRPVDSSSFVAGLDGLRALAVIAVLAFHLQIGVASGGFLGVSLFFTLSGYLITQLLLREQRTTGRIDVRSFWVRRLRRLMPGAIILIIGVAVAAIAFDRFPSERLRGDLFAALGYAANWRFMSASTSYADLFTSAPSPVLHFWSLAIEEQFYIVFPLVMAGLLTARRKWVVAVGLVTLLSASVASGFATASHNVVYYGAQTRAAEILAGAVLALVLPLGGFGTDANSRLARCIRSRVVNTVVFGGALGAYIFLVAVVETSDDWLYSGGLAAVSALSVVLIVAVQSPGPIRWLAERPLAMQIGALSYGLYLFHWPIFQLITEDSTPFTGVTLHIVRLAVTVIVAWLSARFVERPIRERRIVRSARATWITLVGAIAVAVAVIAVVPRTPARELAGLDTPEGFVAFGDERPALKILIVGAEPSISTLVRTALEDDYELDLVDRIDTNCPLQPAIESDSTCADAVVRLEELVDEHRPDLAVIGFAAVDRSAVLASLPAAPATPIEPQSTSQTVEQDGSQPEDAAYFDATKVYVDRIADALATTPKILVDLGPPDAMTAFLEDAALRSTSTSALVSPSAVDIVRTVGTIRSMAAGQDGRERVMVIGDSTSYGIAMAIDHLEGDRISVLWAGGQNCPLVDVAAVKWWDGVEFDLERCPSLDDEWMAALDSFRPSLVVVAVSVPEQAEQRYPGDPEWYVPGSDRYVQVHDDFVSRFMAAVDARGIDVMILDSPTIHGGALSGAPFSSPERVAIWNGVISRWAQLWPRLVVVGWSAALAAFEPTPGALRLDGVHLAQADLDVLVDRALIPPIVEKLFGLVSAVEPETQPVEGP